MQQAKFAFLTPGGALNANIGGGTGILAPAAGIGKNALAAIEPVGSATDILIGVGTSSKRTEAFRQC